MSDRNRQLNLAEALRALPLAAPERSAWPELAAKLQRNPVELRTERVRRFVVPAALAAALIGVFIFVQQPRESRTPEQTASHTPAIPATVAPASASSSANSTQADEKSAAQLAALQQRSQNLERWLHDTGNAAAPLQGQDLAAATEIENLIGLVDVELAAPREAQDASLWQQRVALLEDLSALRYSNYQLAAGGHLVATSLTN
jgi:hypothetical protein